MKKILFALMLTVISLSTFAQSPQNGQRREFKPEDMAARQADRIKAACETTDAQYQALYGYFLRQSNV